MPVWADPRRGPHVRLLADDDLTMVATFVAPPGTRPTAADFRAVVGIDLERVARLALRDLPGVRLITRAREAEALVRAGAEVEEESVHMVRPLDGDPPPVAWAAPELPAGHALQPLGAPVAEYAAAQDLAFPPGHPEHVGVRDAAADGTLTRLLAGEVMGPVYEDAAAQVRDGDGRLVAAILVVHWPTIGDEWAGGPWVVDLFKVPGTAPGIGSAVLQRAIIVAALDAHPAIGISVHAGNRAIRLYERLGFATRFRRISLRMPGQWQAE